ncbi:hypothetical protein [Bradyrhizobium mercantei]|uniref:hypothetical protein n=1 Tax=Bradyrhizobium mercantei TaxID=1904807 RepID=UPI0013564B40|nr:hypothetical protein [Bradyrhizobium mercantei]
MKDLFNIATFAIGAFGFALFVSSLRPDVIGQDRSTRLASAVTRLLIPIKASNGAGEKP